MYVQGVESMFDLDYNDAGGDYFAPIDPDKQTRRLVAQLERLGHVVTLQEAAA